MCDIGIPYAILDSHNMDYRRVYENVVCLKLLRIGDDVYPKMIIARKKHPKYTYEGNEIYDIAEWLLNEV